MQPAGERLDRRVIHESVVEILRACREVVPCHLGGGGALSAAYLQHRLTGDVDLFVHDREDMRELARRLPAVAAERGAELSVVRDAGHLVRARLTATGATVEVDLVHEPVADLEPAQEIDGVEVESLTDLRANKITCILSRSEPRDLVDLLFLERNGFRIEDDLRLALQKDAGIDPGTLAWLLHDFPCEPLPELLKPLSVDELREFRNSLADRLRLIAAGPG